MHWIKISQILCVFGFVKEFRPNEPFVFDYLVSASKNFTSDEVTQNIYPIATYSNFATLIVVFLLTDFLRYKPIIILCGLSGIATFTILVLGTTIPAIQAVEFFYGLYLSTEVAYYTYIYAKVDKEHYQMVSSYTRSALLLGRFVTGIVAQSTISFDLLDYHQLNYLTIGGQVLATIWSLFLPSVGQSVYFHRPDDSSDRTNDNEIIDRISNEQTINNIPACKSQFAKIRRAYYLLWKDFVKAFTDIHVIKWSIWWAAASCGYLQVLTYAQPIWRTTVSNDETIYNGAVESASTVIGALAVFAIGKLKLNWTLLGESVLSVFSFIEAVLLFIIARSGNIWMQYIIYIVFGVIYHTIVTVCCSEVAKKISDDSFGLVFGINIFIALCFQSILTFIVTSGNVFVLDIRTQFAVYSGYFVVLGVIFMVMAVYTITMLYKQKEKLILWNKTERQ